MKTLEEDLQSQERRTLPPAWKDEILANAGIAPPPSTITWFFPTWLRLGLAAVWFLILILNLTNPSDDGQGTSTSNQWAASTQNRFNQLATILAYEDIRHDTLRP